MVYKQKETLWEAQQQGEDIDKKRKKNRDYLDWYLGKKKWDMPQEKMKNKILLDHTIVHKPSSQGSPVDLSLGEIVIFFVLIEW